MAKAPLPKVYRPSEYAELSRLRLVLVLRRVKHDCTDARSLMIQLLLPHLVCCYFSTLPGDRTHCTVTTQLSSGVTVRTQHLTRWRTLALSSLITSKRRTHKGALYVRGVCQESSTVLSHLFAKHRHSQSAVLYVFCYVPLTGSVSRIDCEVRTQEASCIAIFLWFTS